MLEILTCLTVVLGLLVLFLGFALRIQFDNNATIRGWYEEERDGRMSAENRRDEAIDEAKKLRASMDAARQALR